MVDLSLTLADLKVESRSVQRGKQSVSVQKKADFKKKISKSKSAPIDTPSTAIKGEKEKEKEEEPPEVKVDEGPKTDDTTLSDRSTIEIKRVAPITWQDFLTSALLQKPENQFLMFTQYSFPIAKRMYPDTAPKLFGMMRNQYLEGIRDFDDLVSYISSPEKFESYLHEMQEILEVTALRFTKPLEIKKEPPEVILPKEVIVDQKEKGPEEEPKPHVFKTGNALLRGLRLKPQTPSLLSPSRLVNRYAPPIPPPTTGEGSGGT